MKSEVRKRKKLIREGIDKKRDEERYIKREREENWGKENEEIGREREREWRGDRGDGIQRGSFKNCSYDLTSSKK